MDNQSSSTTTTNNNNQYLKHVNKLSHKITKPKTIHNQSQPLIPPPPPPLLQSQPLNQQSPPPPQHQPPVYNINKSDFRNVVQKLTGSPAFNTPPPIQPVKSTSSRLQKIRPPPLPQINVNPAPGFLRQPLSPLPPFPSVHAAAESPISAYMRYIQNSTFLSPRWSSFNQPPENNALVTSSSYGCIPSPKSPYPPFSPTKLGFPLSPTVPSPRWKGI